MDMPFLMFLLALIIQIMLYAAGIAVSRHSTGNKNVLVTPVKLKRLVYLRGMFLTNI